MSLSILIIGTGAIGSFYGAKLAQAGADISIVSRSDYETVKNQGISIKSKDGDFHFSPKKVMQRPEGSYDIVIVATKSLPEIDPKTLCGDAVKNQTPILLIQNGMFGEDAFKKAFPNNPIYSALAFICVSRTSSGIVLHKDYGRLEIEETPITKELAKMWEKTGVPCKTVKNVQKAKWKKLVWNAPFNPLSVITGGATTAKLLNQPTMESLIREVMKEICLLAETDGHPLNEDVIEKNIRDTKVMPPYKTSMLLDHENHRPMEIDAILGAPIQFAERHNVNVPNLKALHAILNLIQKSQ